MMESKDVNGIDSLLLNRRIDGNLVLKTKEFPLLKVKANKKYDNGKFLDEVESYSYVVVERKSYSRIRVKVDGTEPVISDEDLQELRKNDQDVLVSFDSLTVTQYLSNKGIITDSFKATGVKIVE